MKLSQERGSGVTVKGRGWEKAEGEMPTFTNV